MEKEFDTYMDVFKKAPLSIKKETTIQEVKELLGLLSKLKSDLHIPDHTELNKEVLDMKETNATEDDYVEAMFAYLHALKESFAEYASFQVKLLYKEEES